MTETVPAADLIAQAHAATSNEELDAIEAQADGRITVINAVHDRRDQLAAQSAREVDQTVTEAPVVDPSPAAAPIMLNAQTLDEVLAAFPAEASPQEVLDLKPNDYESATSGPDAQISMTLYTHLTKPDGTDFIVPKANVEHYEAKGYTVGADEDIPDLGAYLAERAAS